MAAVAQAQVQDSVGGMGVPEAINHFASIGSYGKNPQNEERDLHRWLSGLYGLQLELYELRLRLQVT